MQEIVGKLLNTTINKKGKRNKTVMLAKSTLNNIESKMSEASKNSEISHENFLAIINEEENIEN